EFVLASPLDILPFPTRRSSDLPAPGSPWMRERSTSWTTGRRAATTMLPTDTDCRHWCRISEYSLSSVTRLGRSFATATLACCDHQATHARRLIQPSSRFLCMARACLIGKACIERPGERARG